MAIGGYSRGGYVIGTFDNSTARTSPVDKDEFKVDGETYIYDRPTTTNLSHVCVKQGQPATD